MVSLVGKTLTVFLIWHLHKGASPLAKAIEQKYWAFMVLAYPLRLVLVEGRNDMETATILRDRSSYPSEQLNWPFLTFWVTYVSVMLGFVYAMST